MNEDYKERTDPIMQLLHHVTEVAERLRASVAGADMPEDVIKWEARRDALAAMIERDKAQQNTIEELIEPHHSDEH